METDTIPTKSEISFDAIRTDDVLLIRTLNGLYRFSVSDSVRRYGTLIGGVFKDRPVDGYLCRIQSLKQGSRAHFMVRAEDRLRFITTSIIIELTHIMCG